MGGVVKKITGGGAKPAVVPAPAPPKASSPAISQDTSSAVTAQATPQTGRAANISAGSNPTLGGDSADPFSVRKRLLGY